MDELKVHSKPIRAFYLWAGIIATIAYRIIIVMTDVNTFWIKLSWYVGTIGFIIYFMHRYDISEKRAKIIKEYNLEGKVSQIQNLDEKDKSAMKYILHSLGVSSEKTIYIVIFVTSALALFAGIYLDFIR